MITLSLLWSHSSQRQELHLNWCCGYWFQKQVTGTMNGLSLNLSAILQNSTLHFMFPSKASRQAFHYSRSMNPTLKNIFVIFVKEKRPTSSLQNNEIPKLHFGPLDFLPSHPSPQKWSGCLPPAPSSSLFHPGLCIHPTQILSASPSHLHTAAIKHSSLHKTQTRAQCSRDCNHFITFFELKPTSSPSPGWKDPIVLCPLELLPTLLYNSPDASGMLASFLLLR